MSKHTNMRQAWWEHSAGIATYNLKVGRDWEWREDWLIDQIRSRDIEVLFVQEAAHYYDFLKDVAKACGMDLYMNRSGKDTGNCAILLSKTMGSPSRRRQIFRRMKRMWWGAKNKTWRAPRVFVAEKRAGVWWGCGHRVAYQFDNRNVMANEEYDRVVAATINSRPNARWVVAMDWNDGARNEDIRAIAERVDGKMHYVKGDIGIDYWMAVNGKRRRDGGVKRMDIVKEFRLQDKGGSDHPMKTAEARW